MQRSVSTDVVSNVQLGSVQLYVVLIMLCTGRALDCVVSALYSWGMEAWKMFCHAYSLWNDASVVGQSGCWMHRNDKHRFVCVGRGMPSRKDPKVLPRILARNRIPSSCAGISKKQQCVSECRRMKGPRHVKSNTTEEEQEWSSAVTSAAKRSCSRQAREAWWRRDASTW